MVLKGLASTMTIRNVSRFFFRAFSAANTQNVVKERRDVGSSSHNAFGKVTVDPKRFRESRE